MQTVRHYQSLIDILPGQNKELIGLNSKLPSDIIKILDQYNKKTDTVVLTNGDVWRYFDLKKEIFDHPNLIGKYVFLQTLGYTNTKFNDTCWEISYPRWYWSRKVSNKPFSIFNKNLEYGFSCLNNRASLHRLLLGYEFYKKDLLKTIIFSQNDFGAWWKDNLPLPTSFSELKDFNKYANLLPIRVEELEDHTFFSKDNTNTEFVNFCNDHSINHLAYTNSYCNIVTESECEEFPYSRNINLPVITEKSYKPFRAGQVPLMLAAQGHIAYLKGLGFEMMEDLLPFGYDEMNVLQKIESIAIIVEQGRDFIQDFYFNHLKEIQHNYELVNSDKVEKLILQRIKDIL